MKIVVASNNKKKRQEIEAILATLGIELVAAADTCFVDVIEDADSFAGNARKKAEAFAMANHLPALADDSGLCVDALNGAPGIYSARYAGEDGNDGANNSKLLQALHTACDRSAHFTCALHLAFPDQRPAITAEGQVHGMILEQATGIAGFGYDPLFFCPEIGKAFAEATAEEKAGVSHRGRALRALAEQLSHL
ncbi:RdgB/HAM1 family non-canonical purine NTP pyrophosphatase [Mariprofundus erugo]|uniref:dITP/XTP pyrophosphatase n=1 Tax=Mariprofundus erugo TaxID=2528639 RepID=A0A5R9GMW5_9PROT|nr:RdgB/HAM1 family non-canonical purine NTP pyrophosphatase [Mariprofundus erugo]TLS78032.1 RdgB/HAM1 family non-canonical purine NTP pyrophosphatase [Mariprofundus erugo]